MLKAISSLICAVFGCKPMHHKFITRTQCLRCGYMLFALLLLFAACAPAGTLPQPLQRRNPVIVDNRNFYDARIRLDGRRIGAVRGLTTDTLYAGIVGGTGADLVIQLIGGGGSVLLGKYNLDGRELRVLIAPRLASSQAWVE